jgi:hypothetical protein
VSIHLALTVIRAYDLTYVASSALNIHRTKLIAEMATRKSARNLVRAQPSNKDSTTSRPKRGSHGFHKFKNGFLNLTPVSDDETAL